MGTELCISSCYPLVPHPILANERGLIVELEIYNSVELSRKDFLLLFDLNLTNKKELLYV